MGKPFTPAARPELLLPQRHFTMPQQSTTPGQVVLDKKLARKRLFLDLIRCHGPLSRVDISRAFGFNFRTVCRLVDELVQEELVHEKPTKRSSIGRAPILLSLNANAASVLGIEIVKDHVTLTLMDLGARILSHRKVAADLTIRPDAYAEMLEGIVLEFLRSDGDPYPPIAGACLAGHGIYCLVDGEQKWFEVYCEPILIRLTQALGVPAKFEGSVSAMSFGELWFGKVKSLRNFAAFYVGDGIGAGLVCERKFYYGFTGNAGDIGHVKIGEPGIACYCGGSGCLENTASGSGLVRMAASTGFSVQGRVPSADEIFEAAATDESARRIVAKFSRGLSRGVATVITLFNPEAVIISGPLARYSDMFMRQVDEGLRELIIPVGVPKLLISNLHKDAVALGTCARILNQIFGVPSAFEPTSDESATEHTFDTLD